MMKTIPPIDAFRSAKVAERTLLSRSERRRNAVSQLTVLLVGLLCCLSLACQAGSEEDEVLDTGALLARYEKHRRRHDPIHFSEVDLGEFMVTQSHSPAIYFVRFHLFGVIPDQHQALFDEAIASHAERVRSVIRTTVQNSELEHLDDPSLSWLKSELITKINRSLKSRLLRDVVFTNFSFERG